MQSYVRPSEYHDYLHYAGLVVASAIDILLKTATYSLAMFTHSFQYY